MKTLIISSILLLSMNTMVSFANGSEKHFLEVGKYITLVDPEDRVEVKQGNIVVHLKTRQVGLEESLTVPYPTVCTYFETSKIFKEDNEYYYFKPLKFELVGGDENCSNFIQEMQNVDGYTINLKTDFVKEY